MAFVAAQIAFLQRLVSQRPATREAGGQAVFFSEHYGIGVTVGRRVEYGDIHFLRAESLLKTNDLPSERLPVGASRADAALYGGMSEKDFSAAPHSDSIAVKSLGRCRLDGREMFAPEGAYIVLTVHQALAVSCDRLMVVENLETFRRLEAYTWLDRGDLAVLAIFRGDSELSGAEVRQVLSGRTEPLWAFTDFDPAGLGIATGLPSDRFQRLVLPGRSWLEAAANNPRGRQLFDRQVKQYQRVLDAAEHPEIASAWSLMKGLRSAVTQERMMRLD